MCEHEPLRGHAREFCESRVEFVVKPASKLSPIVKTHPSRGFDADLFERLEEVEGRSFWFKARVRLIVAALQRIAPNANTFLDVGCGTGGVLEALARARPCLSLMGRDPLLEAVERTRARVPTADVQIGSVETLALDRTVDIVGAFDVLEHVDDDVGALAGLSRAVRRGGFVMLLAPQHPSLWSDLDVLADHRRRYARGELERKARSVGLATVISSSFVSTPLAAAALTRNGHTDDPLRPLLPRRPVNALLAWTLAAEAAVVVRGLRLPVGLSVFYVGRREL